MGMSLAIKYYPTQQPIPSPLPVLQYSYIPKYMYKKEAKIDEYQIKTKIQHEISIMYKMQDNDNDDYIGMIHEDVR